MLRVLLVLEDYGELVFLQTVLKKIGFDVDAIQNPRAFNDSVLRFNPDLIVMTAYGKRVKGVDLSRSVKKVRGIPRMIMIRSANQPKDADPMIEGWLESPVAAIPFLNLVGELCGLDPVMLADKFTKLKLQDPVEGGDARVLNLQDAGGGAAEPTLDRSKDSQERRLTDSTMSSKERQERYRKFTSEKPAHVGFGVKQVQEQVKSLRKLETSEDLADLEKERKAFVEHLFNKKRA